MAFWGPGTLGTTPRPISWMPWAWRIWTSRRRMRRPLPRWSRRSCRTWRRRRSGGLNGKGGWAGKKWWKKKGFLKQKKWFFIGNGSQKSRFGLVWGFRAGRVLVFLVFRVHGIGFVTQILLCCFLLATIFGDETQRRNSLLSWFLRAIAKPPGVSELTNVGGFEALFKGFSYSP